MVANKHTQAEANYGRGDPYGRYIDAVRGYYCALLEAHIPFDVLSDKFLDDARLAQASVAQEVLA